MQDRNLESPIYTPSQRKYFLLIWSKIGRALATSRLAPNLFRILDIAYDFLYDDMSRDESSHTSAANLGAVDPSTTERQHLPLTHSHSPTRTPKLTPVVITPPFCSTTRFEVHNSASLGSLQASCPRSEQSGLNSASAPSLIASNPLSTELGIIFNQNTIASNVRNISALPVAGSHLGHESTCDAPQVGTPVGTKADLTLDEVSKYAATLLLENPRSIFLEHCPYIYGAWLSSLSMTTGCSPIQSIIASFDLVLSLARDKDKTYREISGCLPLRFGYVQLVGAIDDFNKEAEEAGRSCRKTYHMGTISINAYVEARTSIFHAQASKEKLRSELAVHATNARRMCDLTFKSPMMLSVYSVEAEAIA